MYRVWIAALLVSVIVLTSACGVFAQQGSDSLLLDIYSGEFAKRGGWMSSKYMNPLIESFPEIAPSLIYSGMELLCVLPRYLYVICLISTEAQLNSLPSISADFCTLLQNNLYSVVSPTLKVLVIRSSKVHFQFPKLSTSTLA
jgi:hypothetical protein